MGLVLGKINVETPKYTVLGVGQDYEIREYGSNVVAEVSYDPTSKGNDGGFMILAAYIGALGKACNVKVEGQGKTDADEGEKIAMTAPVITQETGAPADSEKIAMTTPVFTKEGEKIAESEKIAMTAPVLTEERLDATQVQKKMMVMQFVLPSKYTMDNVPRPTNPLVVVKEVPSRKYGVLRFSGIADDKLVAKKLELLSKALEDAGYKVVGDYVLARYNPPWTIPFLRTNEVMLPVE